MIRKITAVLLLLFLLSVSRSFAVSDGLVLYLPFNGHVMDASGNGNNGTLNGKETWVDGKVGKALEFDGATYIEIPDKENSGFDDVPGLTIESWVKINNHHDNGIVVKLTTEGVFWPCSYNLETWSDGLLYFDIGDDVGSYTTATYSLGEWFHVAGVFDGNVGEDRLYINGELASTNPRPEEVVPDGDLPVYIGCIDPVSFFFMGMLDELAIYSRALDQAEIVEDMSTVVAIVENKDKLSTTWAEIKK